MKIISVIQTFRRVVLRMLEKRTDGGWRKNILEKVYRIKEGGGETFMQKNKNSHVISIKFTLKISRKLISWATRKNKMSNCITNVVYIFSGSNYAGGSFGTTFTSNQYIFGSRSTAIAAFTPTISAVYVLLL